MNNRELIGKIVGMIQKNQVLWDGLRHRNMLNEKRLLLLHEILLAIDREEVELARERLFQYGTLIKKKDVVARQIFLYLLISVEEQEKLQAGTN